jgi:predicted small integral membrane protein
MKWSFSIGALFGLVFTLLEQKKSWRLRAIPDGHGHRRAHSTSAVTTIFLGALADWIWERTRPGVAPALSIAIASGFIAGEAIVA